MSVEIDLKGLRELESKATPGPWKIEDPISEEWWLVQADKLSYEWEPLASVTQGDENGIPQETAQANVNFLCAARNALPALLDEIKRLRGYPSTAAREETDQRASDALAAAFRQRDAAETELSALKAKMEKVREWVTNPPVHAIQVQYPAQFESLTKGLLAILDGKEG